MNAQVELNQVGELDRSLYIGGSDAAAILGVSKWRTALDVYMDKVNGKQPDDPSKAKIFARGKRMEPYIIDLFAEETGLNIIRRGFRYQDPEYPFLCAEIDAEAESGENIEIKTVHPFASKDWGIMDTDDIPVYYAAQAMHGLMVTGKQVCIFGAMIGMDDFRTYRVERDEDVIQLLRQKEIAFWHNMEQRIPPEAQTLSDAERLFKKDSGLEVEADAESLEAIMQLKELKAQAKQLDVQIEAAETKVKLAMKDASVITMSGQPLITWKNQTTNRFSTKEFQAAYPALYEQFKKPSESRVMRIK
ncbi:YqaJ viral recombinase family protein [Tolumonas lignilytica]|uniref:YqaJ viral recombinase family nuclease n=1 Tax=Tolumonas lignilytica TaxID=1283284 RepID=UPI000467ECED|nr:YqaJ viral recombinase family protein [Tolumonas lignilytica]